MNYVKSLLSRFSFRSLKSKYRSLGQISCKDIAQVPEDYYKPLPKTIDRAAIEKAIRLRKQRLQELLAPERAERAAAFAREEEEKRNAQLRFETFLNMQRARQLTLNEMAFGVPLVLVRF